MADKTISQLTAAPSALGEYTGQELFVLEQNNTAKKLTMQILENWLVSFADGHGGIQTINKTGTSGLVDTYTITFADQSTATFTVTNGNGITGVTQYWAVSSSSTTVPSSWSTTRQTMTPTNKYLWSYMTFARDSGTFSTTKSVVGVYGDTGQNWYVWIKYAGVQPTSDADMGDTPDNWMGIYSGTASTAPTHYTSYQWFEIKGEKGDTGDTGASIASVTRTGGTGEPGSTDTYTITLDTGTVAGTFTVYNGLNGSGAVSTVNGIQPDGSGNVAVTAADIQATSGTVQSNLESLQTAVNGKQGTISASGVLKGNGSGTVTAATMGTDFAALSFTVTLTTSGWANNTQIVVNSNFVTSGYAYIVTPDSGSFADYASSVIYADNVSIAREMIFHCENVPASSLTVNIMRVVSA